MQMPHWMHRIRLRKYACSRAFRHIKSMHETGCQTAAHFIYFIATQIIPVVVVCAMFGLWAYGAWTVFNLMY